MKLIKVTKNFYLQEYIDPFFWGIYAEQCIRFLDPVKFTLSQFLRDRYGKSITINNWHVKGIYKESGLRRRNTKTGSYYSAHKSGRADDLKIKGMIAEEVRQDILKHEALFFEQGLRAIELDTPTWVHLSTENFNMRSIKLISLPVKGKNNEVYNNNN